MTAATLVSRLRARGVALEPDGDYLVVRPARAVTSDEVEALRQLKPQVLALLATPTLHLDVTTVREILGLHPDPHDLASLKRDVMAAVREIETEIESGTITPGVRLVHGRPLADWLGMEQLAQLMGAWDERIRRRP